MVAAARIALITCAAVHFYGASAYFSNRYQLQVLEDTAGVSAPGLHVTPDAPTIKLEFLTLLIAAVLVAVFLCRARVGGTFNWWWACWLLAVWPQVVGREVLSDGDTWSDLHLGNALECGGEAMTATVALVSVVLVTLISLRQSRRSAEHRPAPQGSGRSPLASRT